MKDKVILNCEFRLLENNENIMKIEEIDSVQDSLNKRIYHHILEKQKIVNDFIYENLETNILQEIKTKIENELLKRKLKDEVNQ